MCQERGEVPLFLVQAEAPHVGIKIVGRRGVKIGVRLENEQLIRVGEVVARTFLAGEAEGFLPFRRRRNVLGLV